MFKLSEALNFSYGLEKRLAKQLKMFLFPTSLGITFKVSCVAIGQHIVRSGKMPSFAFTAHKRNDPWIALTVAIHIG